MNALTIQHESERIIVHTLSQLTVLSRAYESLGLEASMVK